MEAAVLRWLCGFGRRRGFVDVPGGRKRHARPTPYLGGLGILAGAACGLAAVAWLLPDLLAGRERVLLAVGFGSAGFTLLGLLDDLNELEVRFKVPIQLLLAAAVLALLPDLRTSLQQLAPWGMPEALSGWLLPALWIFALANALNLIDGMDGLLASVSLVASAALSFLSLPSPGLSGPLFVLFAALLLVFLAFFNFPPAKIFLGNNGTMLLGFLFSFCSLYLAAERGRRFPVSALFFVFLLPAIEVATSVGRRLLARRSIFEPDREHLHHRLLELGLSPRRVLLVLGGYSLLATSISFTSERSRVFFPLAVLLFVASAGLTLMATGEPVRRKTP